MQTREKSLVGQIKLKTRILTEQEKVMKEKEKEIDDLKVELKDLKQQVGNLIDGLLATTLSGYRAISGGGRRQH